MGKIRAPFNFVPLSEKVFFPEWANQISQDIPFSDGISGTIDMTITAESPIFIRNGHTKEDEKKNNSEYNSFSHITLPNGHPLYFIPATSIKGEVRNLLEIMSFSKMDVDKRAKFTCRDLTKYADYPLKADQKRIHCGWLRQCQNNGNEKKSYIIEDCGRTMRIGQPDIDKYLNCNILTDHFSEKSDFDLEHNVEIDGKLYDPKTALFKNKLVENKKPLKDLTFKVVGHNQIGDKKVVIDYNGKEKGTIILTGQPNKWKEKPGKERGKYYEFVFPEVENPAVYTISKEEFERFAFIYKDSVEWPNTKDILDNGRGRGVPVFFRIENGKIKDFGLTYLYRILYNNSVYESLYDDHKKQEADLAECIFGYTNDKASLKGRVQFGNAYATKAECIESVKLALSSPKASYVPIYVEQEGGDKYTTYDTGHPRGWKRYHIRQNVWKHEADVNKEGEDSQNTTIYPLNTGSEFKTTISFHNLRPIELGALLSAITFFNTADCHHQLGQAKPYGYGICKYDIKEIHLFNINKTDDKTDVKQTERKYMKAFESYMNEKLGVGNSWVKQPQIIQLLTLASQKVPDTEKFKYMELSEYTEAKKNQESLLPATSLGLREMRPESILRPSKRDASNGIFSLIPEEPNFGDWLSAMKAFEEQGHETLTKEECEFAFEQLKAARKTSEKHNAPMIKWKAGGENFKRCKKLKIVGKALATEWFEKLQEED